MKLLIVDDEKQIRNGLKDTIDWKSIGISYVYAAKGGFEALEIAKNVAPEIALVDIRMPEMDGLELSKRLKELYPNIHILLVSGYSDFNYAKQGILIGVENYLTKPVNINELLTTLKKIVDNTKYAHIINSPSKSIDDSQIFQNILQNSGSLENDYKSKLSNVSIYFNKDYIFCLIFNIDNYLKYMINLKSSNFSVIKNKLKKIMFNILQNQFTCIYFNSPIESQICFYINCKYTNNLSDLRYKIENALEYFKSTLDESESFITITVGISKLFNKYELIDAFNDANQAIKHKFFIGNGKIIFSKHVKKSYSAEPPAIDTQLNKLISLVKTLNVNALMDQINIIFNKYRKCSVKHIPIIKNSIITIFKTLDSEFKLISLNNNVDGFTYYEDYYDKITSFETLNDYMILLENICFENINIINLKLNNTNNNNLIRLAKSYINKNFKNNISIQSVSAYVGRNPNYFCHIFKKETGVSLSEYIGQLRIKEAKKLLLNTSYMAYEIADKTGFSSYKHFYKYFKKSTGMTPTEYRSSISSDIIKN